ncbi:MAG: N-acetyl-gamma-glutamyl-phosphate reductase [Acidobacteria bacterium RIFCSPHIGHO2_02_FULL_67_57]|nr:MAG: N-acetyl-gamma-glutamyl-phosphate reductase [Acidobacteria bacterium RIFCSPHIGHO2_02_FULL_67_57]
MARPVLQSAVVGPTGYVGFELTRLLLRHPRLKPPLLLTRESSGNGQGELADLFPQVSGNGSLPLQPFSWSAVHAKGVDLLFLATPHETARAWLPEAVRRGLRVIDLSAAWRLRTPAYRAAYNFADTDPAAADSVQQQAVYGLPELVRELLPEAHVVANPGCYPTSVILALAPFVRAGLVDTERGIVADSKSGVSGAGKQATPETHFVEVASNFRAYSVFTHRHTGEILEQLGLAPAELVFTTHLLPIPRGILSTIYVHLRKPLPEKEVEQCLRDFYAGCPFVRVFAPPRLPEIQYSLNTNYCDIGFALDAGGTRLVLVSCLDNLLKGAAGQAVQNLNLVYGWDEKEGLA